MRSVQIILFMLVLACKSPAPDPKTDDIPTRGDILMLADEDFRSVLEAQELAFENIYPDARVRIQYLPQATLLENMMSDSVRAVFTTCLPGGEQEAYFRTRRLSPDIVPILIDGIAAVRAPGSGRDTLSIEGLTSALASTGGMKLVFDGRRTGVLRTMIDSLLGGDVAAVRNASAVLNPDSLIRRIAQDPGALGLLSFARISDMDDPRCRALRTPVELCAISSNGRPALVPNQSTLADGSYPLRRMLYAVVTEGKSGLGTGFVSFVAGHKGQRIILKSGLAPIRVPARNVEIVN